MATCCEIDRPYVLTWLIRVVGPDAGAWAGRVVIATRTDDTKHTVRLTRIVWTGTDATTGQAAALYTLQEVR